MAVAARQATGRLYFEAPRLKHLRLAVDIDGQLALTFIAMHFSVGTKWCEFIPVERLGVMRRFTNSAPLSRYLERQHRNFSS